MTKLHRVVAIAFVIVIVVAIYIVVVLFLVRPHVRRSSPSACSVHPSVGQASPLLRPFRPFVWSKGATGIVARLVRSLVIDQYGRAAAVIPQAAACSLCFPTTVPSLVPPLLFAVAHVLQGPRASFLAFLKHVQNTEAGGSRLRCPLYSGHRNCTSSLFAALKRMVLGRENACHSSWTSGVAVWVSFRCRLDGRKLHILLVFLCKIVLNRIPPHVKYHCDLGAV